METSNLIRLLPDLQTIAELFDNCAAQTDGNHTQYRSIRLYRPGMIPEKGTLYLLWDRADFPVDEFAYISGSDIPGGAEHLTVPGMDPYDILDRVLSLYQNLRSMEDEIDSLVFRNASLQELCQVGARLLENPVYIHDDWFMMMAQSEQVSQILSPEYVMSSTRGFLPRMIIDDFRDDSDYLETYAHRSVQIWENANGRCLYGNLWEGEVYRGRLLVIENNRPLRAADRIITQVLTQRALSILQRKRTAEHGSRSMDDVMYTILQGDQPEPADLIQLLNMLNWNQEDRLLCIRIQSQRPDITAAESHILHSDLFRCFPDAYIMFTPDQQYVILNLTRHREILRMIHHTLSPLCRDYCLYAGISSPVLGIRDLHLAFYQAETSLNQAFRMRNEKWIVDFSDCVLDHVLNNLDSPLQPWHLVSPDLHLLLEMDREKGTQYFDTLKIWLLLERNIPAASEALIIHRTTLLYRLKKIQSLISADLDDPWQRLYLLLSLKILENSGK